MKHVVKGLNLLICGLHLSVSLSKDPRRSTFLFLQCVYFLLILFYLILSCRMYARFLACPLSLEVYSQSPRVKHLWPPTELTPLPERKVHLCQFRTARKSEARKIRLACIMDYDQTFAQSEKTWLRPLCGYW